MSCSRVPSVGWSVAVALMLFSTRVSALSISGSDSLVGVMNAAIAGCPGAQGLTFVGGGTNTGETSLVAGTQRLAPMDRALRAAACAFPGGASHAAALPFAAENADGTGRRYYLNTTVGFENLTGPELALFHCFQSATFLNPVLAANNFYPVDAVCQDFNEHDLCGAAVNAGSCGLAITKWDIKHKGEGLHCPFLGCCCWRHILSGRSSAAELAAGYGDMATEVNGSVLHLSFLGGAPTFSDDPSLTVDAPFTLPTEVAAALGHKVVQLLPGTYAYSAGTSQFGDFNLNVSVDPAPVPAFPSHWMFIAVGIFGCTGVAILYHRRSLLKGRAAA